MTRAPASYSLPATPPTLPKPPRTATRAVVMSIPMPGRFRTHRENAASGGFATAERAAQIGFCP
jgi:hypothetical protein